MSFLRVGFLLVLAGAVACGADAPRPNIVVFLSDDMGWKQVGFTGGKEVPTPHVDRLAKEGIRLTQFYVQPALHAYARDVHHRPLRLEERHRDPAHPHLAARHVAR